MQLAERLRQAVQGCTLHPHGPLQAFAQIQDARRAGMTTATAVLAQVGSCCSRRLRQLQALGVGRDDPRWRKELAAAEFCTALLRETGSMSKQPETPAVDIGRMERAMQDSAAPLIEKLRTHPLGGKLTTLAALRVFMEHHVYAVWDFMSLLKALQQSVTCVTTPWLPTPDPAVRRFINSIVLDEESDEFSGQAGSHFEIYLQAMAEVGADTQPITRFLDLLREGNLFSVAAVQAGVPAACVEFMAHTMNVVHRGQTHAIAAAFTIGREAAIPAMFTPLVEQLVPREQCPLLLEYLKRHIDLDGDTHAPLAAKLVRSLCGDNQDRWEAAIGAGITALQARRQLWAAVEAAL